MLTNRAKFHYDNYYPDMNIVLGSYILWQAGDLRCEPGYVVPEHVQEVHELSYIVSGQGAFVVDGISYPVSKGNVFINRISERHTVQSSTHDPLRYYYLGFDFVSPNPSEVAARIQSYWERPDTRLISKASGIQDAFMDLLNEIATNDFLSSALMESYVQRILCETYRQLRQRGKSKYLLHEDHKVDEKLGYDVLQYIDTRMEACDNLKELCNVFGYSYAHIANHFKAVTGESLSQYCARRRFERAQDNLRRGMSITKVAESVGFRSIHAFSRAYKKHFGQAPSQSQAELLRESAATGADQALAQPDFAITLAVIGCGDLAQRVWIPALARNPRVHLKYFCDIDPARCMESINRFHCGAAATEYRQMLRDPELDAVAVCVPTDRHVTLVTDALNADKAVLCSLPAARTLEGALEMHRIAQAKGRVLMMDAANRYDSAVQVMRQYILSDALGEVYHVYVSFRAHRAIPGLGGALTTRAIAGGGVLIDQGLHYLDTALYCLDGPTPLTVSAQTFCKLGRDIAGYTYTHMPMAPPKPDGVYDVEDSLTALIRTQGATITIQGAWAQNIAQEALYIDFMGDKAGIRYQFGKDFTVYGTQLGALISYTPEYIRQDPVEREMDAFVDSVRTGRPPASDIGNLMLTTRLVQAIYDSAASRREIDLTREAWS